MSTTLPEPQWWYTDDSQAAMNMGFGLPEEKPLFTADQMHAYGLAVWKAAMEAAAHELEQIANVISGPYESDGHYALLNACATTIRSILPLPEQGGPQ